MKTTMERPPGTPASRTAASHAPARHGRSAAAQSAALLEDYPLQRAARERGEENPRVAQLQRYHDLANRAGPQRNAHGGGLALPPLLQRMPVADDTDVAAGAPVQRVLDPKGVVAAARGQGTQFKPRYLQVLRGMIQTFNQQDAGLGTKVRLHAQFSRLAAIETLVNSWIQTHSATMNEPDRAAAFALAAQIEAEHTRLIGLNLAAGHPLWTGLGRKDKTNVSIQKLWRSLSTNAGNIKIKDGPERVATLAGMAKLLQGAHGRSMLTELNRAQKDPTRNIRIGPDWKKEIEGTPAGADYKSGESGAIAYGSTQKEDDRSHSDNTGTGSYVQIAPGGSVPVTGLHDEPIPMPRYITLGHELGHALHNLRGTSQTVWGRAVNPLEQSLWSNPEELRNIEGEENPLRQEHQLPTRAYHKPPQTVALTKRRFALKQRLDVLLNKIPANLDAAVRARVPAIKLADDMIYAPGDPGPDWQDVKTLDLFEARIATGEKNVDEAIKAGPLPPPRRGMSTRSKVLLGVGVGLSVLAGASYLLSRFMKHT